ncbi:hypothetical protein [Pseudomonas fluorescens]|uniref:hypothetical protein n=1 Tax=Pseudomonas fluorescens TaxID=294 RepID=UPI0007D05569|nr:hypothetical protein [Pseudomonas fluorescens]
MVDFVMDGIAVVPAAKVFIHLEQIEDVGFITCVQSTAPLQVGEHGLKAYCRHLNVEVGEEDAFAYHSICTRVGAFLVIYRSDEESERLGKKAINDAAKLRAEEEGGRCYWHEK